MKKGDIVVYTQNDQLKDWPKNVRDGVVIDIHRDGVTVRPYGCAWSRKYKSHIFRTILPNRLRKNRPKPPVLADSVTPTKKKKAKVLPESEFQTFMGWKALGRYVRQGEKHRKRSENGECLFHKEQTNKKIYAGGYGRNHAHQTFDDEWYKDRTRRMEYPYEVNRTHCNGMGGPYWRIEMSDGSIKEEHIGEGDTPPGLSLGM